MRKILAVAFPLAVASLIGSATLASAQNPFAAGIDGVVTNAVNSGVPSNSTCAQPSPQACRVTDPSGNTKELGPENGNHTKVGVIHTAPALPDNPATQKPDADPMLGFTNPNDQVDLSDIWTQTAEDPTTKHIWFYFAWRRVANSGSGFLAIEMQQSPVTANNNPCVYTGLDLTSNASLEVLAGCNPWKNRQVGDFLFLWDQQGGSRDIYKRVFEEDEDGDLVLGDAILLTSAQAQFSVSGFEGEAAINLSTDVFPTDGSCISFANTIPGTVTGNSDEADYKDTVFATFEPISNCGSLKVIKDVSPTTETGTFTYTVTKDSGDLRHAADEEQYPDDTLSQIQRTLTEHNDFEEHKDLIPGEDYRITEDLIAMGTTFSFVKIVCQTNGGTATEIGNSGVGTTDKFTIAANKGTVCTIYNRQAEGELRIIKKVENGFGLTAVPGDFSFSLSGAAAVVFKKEDNSACTSGAVCRTYTLAAGTNYTVTETPPANWAVTYSNQQDGGNTNSVNCSGTIAAGGVKYCWVINTALVASPNMLTVQTAKLFDSATISGLRRDGTETAMSVEFKVYANQNCTGTPAGSETVQITLGTGLTTVNVPTVNGVLVEGTGGTYYWVAVFSGNNMNETKTSACGREITTISFTYPTGGGGL